MKGKLTNSQLDKFSDILIAIGQVVFASIILPSFFGLDTVKSEVLPSGLVLMFGSWIFGLLVVRGVEG